ncbi:MAG TPA: hypothetical protein VGI58_07985, partial [Streptosporangiaceae bacterium]
VLQRSLGLRGTLLLTAAAAVLGALLTLVLPEPAGRSLEEISGGYDGPALVASGGPSAGPATAPPGDERVAQSA